MRLNSMRGTLRSVVSLDVDSVIWRKYKSSCYNINDFYFNNIRTIALKVYGESLDVVKK